MNRVVKYALIAGGVALAGYLGYRVYVYRTTGQGAKRGIVAGFPGDQTADHRTGA